MIINKNFKVFLLVISSWYFILWWWKPSSIYFIRFAEANKRCPQENSQNQVFLDPSPDAQAEICTGSSVSCHGEQKVNRFCEFKNLCYSKIHQDFVFFHGTSTFQSGLPENRNEPALLDFSSVEDHNTNYFNFVDAPASTICPSSKRIQEGVDFRSGSHLILKRFKPDNLMHLFHDDLLPIFATLRIHRSLTTANTTLVFADPYCGLNTSYHLYDVLNVRDKIHVLEFVANWTCFEHALIGLSKETTWYQYGYHQMQGPLLNKKPKQHIDNFRDTFLNKFCVTSCQTDDFLEKDFGRNGCEKHRNKVILLSRRFTRVILNEAEVVMFLADYFRLPVQVARLEDMPAEEIACLVDKAAVLIGMHGSLLALGLFLKSNSTIIELFPYGINPDKYAPYKTLAEVIGARYAAWANLYREKSIAHPEWKAELGGIQHLSYEEQQKIQSTKVVQDHLCCNDANWLYHIYQDTVVDVPSLRTVLESSVKISQRAVENPVYPTVVRNVSCSRYAARSNTVNLVINWYRPWNIEFFEMKDVVYHVWVKLVQSNKILAYETKSTTLILKGFQDEGDISVWINCLLDNHDGPTSKNIICLT